MPHAYLRVSGSDVDSSNPIPISDAGGALSVDDNGGSLTVDGTVSTQPSGTDTTWQATDADGTGSTTLISALGAGVSPRIKWLYMRETAAAACTLAVSDGTWTLTFDLAASENMAVPIPDGIVGAANTDVTITTTGAGASVDVTATGVSE